MADIYGAKTGRIISDLGPAKCWDEHKMAFSYRAPMPPYAIAPQYGIHRPACLYIPSPIVDYHGFMRECIKHQGATIIDLTEAIGPGLTWEQKWINYVNVVNSIKPWRAAGKPFVCDRLCLWTS